MIVTSRLVSGWVIPADVFCEAAKLPIESFGDENADCLGQMTHLLEIEGVDEVLIPKSGDTPLLYDGESIMLIYETLMEVDKPGAGNASGIFAESPTPPAEIDEIVRETLSKMGIDTVHGPLLLLTMQDVEE